MSRLANQDGDITPLFPRFFSWAVGPFQVREANTLTRAVTRAGRGRARAVYRASREGIHPGRAPKDRGGAIMPLVRSNDAPDSADPVRCAPPHDPSNRRLAHCLFSRPTGFPRTGRALEAVRWTPSARSTRIPRRIQPRDSHSLPSSRFQRLTRPFHPVSLAGPAPYSVWCRPPAHPVRMRQRTQGAPAEGSEGALTAPGGPTAAIRARRSSTPTTSASTRGSLPSLPTLRDERDARQIKFHQPARFERSPPQRSASSSHHPAFSPPRTGTWVTAGSSARAEAPSSA